MESQQHGPRKHPGTAREARLATPIARALAVLAPSGSHKEIQAIFHGRAGWPRIRAWRDGRAMPPQWAVDCLRSRIAPVLEVKAGVGSIVGKYNLPSIKEKARLQGGLDSRPLIEKR